MDGCGQCGFDYESLGPRQLPSAIASLGGRVSSLLTNADDDATLRRRPRPDVWSALEYACHVRDVLLVQRDRLYLALVEDTPTVARMYRERVVLARYNLQEPEKVAEQLTVIAQLAGQAFADLEDVHWQRRLIYNFPTPRERTVTWLAQHTVHEGLHHVDDIKAVKAGRVPDQQ